MVRKAAAEIFFLGFLASPLVSHNYLPPVPGEAVTSIPDIDVSRAAYRELIQGDQVDVYSFTAKKGREIYVQMTVPLLERNRDFAPGFILLYTGTEKVEFDPPELEKGMIVDPSAAAVDWVFPGPGGGESGPALICVEYDGSDADPFFEPFTGTRYWIRQTMTVAAPADGTYLIGVYSPGGTTGKYVLATGEREQFGIGDILAIPGVRWTVRVFNEEPVWPDALVWGVLGMAALGGISYGVYLLTAR
jgi:hypothetical protein